MLSLTQDSDPLTVLCFADDPVIIGKDNEAITALVTLTVSFLQEIGLNLNPQKSHVILISHGKLEKGVIETDSGDIKSISEDEEVKYLGVSFNQTLIFNSSEVLKKF